MINKKVVSARTSMDSSIFYNHINTDHMTEQQLNESVEIMKDRYKKHDHATKEIFQGEELGAKHVKRLVEGGYLREIIEGWFYLPYDRTEEDESEFYMFYWPFVVAYLNSKYFDDWSLGADDSLLFLSGNGVIPRQLVIRSQFAGGKVWKLPLGLELLEVGAEIPDETQRETRYGLRIYPLHLALLKASPGFFRCHPREARSCLALIEDEQSLVDAAVDGGICRGACRVAGGLKSIGNLTMPDDIITALRRYGYDAEMENPFWEDITIPQESTAVVSLIRLLWKEMRDQVANIPHNFCLSPRDRSVAEIMEMTGRAFVTDAFHSLGLSGYCVTKEMAEKAPGGGEEDDEDPSREPDRDEVTAQAYHDAYQKARKDIIDSLTGGDEPAALINRIEGWHTAMQLHLWVMGVRKGGESSGFRKEEITVQESMYIPVEPVAIPEAMKVLSQLLVSEKSAFVRAVLGHFFIAYIHPFTDNNGVIARLFMNSQLVAGGYPWSVIPGWKADLYNDALEKACTVGNIHDLAYLVAESIYRKDITVDSEEPED